MVIFTAVDNTLHDAEWPNGAHCLSINIIYELRGRHG